MTTPKDRPGGARLARRGTAAGIARFVLAAFLFSMTSPGPSHAVAANDVAASLRTLADYRVRARVNAAYVTAACAPALRCDRSYEFYGLLHNRTVTAFGNLIRNTVTRMVEPERRIPAVYTRHTIEDAAVHFALLERAFGRLTARDGANAAAADLRRRIETSQREIARSLHTLAGAYRAGHPAERRRVVADLRALTWDRFDAIRPTATNTGAEISRGAASTVHRNS